MDLSTIVNIILCILSFALAAISVVTVVITLKQNNQMIESTSRPYIAVSFDIMNTGSNRSVFVIKNYGQSSAYIDEFSFNDVIQNHSQPGIPLEKLFDCIPNSSIAPSQKIIIPVGEISDFEYTDIAIFTVKYSYCDKKYEDTFRIPIGEYRKYVKVRHNNTDEQRNISYTLQEIAERII